VDKLYCFPENGVWKISGPSMPMHHTIICGITYTTALINQNEQLVLAEDVCYKKFSSLCSLVCA